MKSLLIKTGLVIIASAGIVMLNPKLRNKIKKYIEKKITIIPENSSFC